MYKALAYSILVLIILACGVGVWYGLNHQSAPCPCHKQEGFQFMVYNKTYTVDSDGYIDRIYEGPIPIHEGVKNCFSTKDDPSYGICCPKGYKGGYISLGWEHNYECLSDGKAAIKNEFLPDAALFGWRSKGVSYTI